MSQHKTLVRDLLQTIQDIQSVHLENLVEGAVPTVARTQSFTVSSEKFSTSNPSNRSYDITASSAPCAGGQILGFRLPPNSHETLRTDGSMLRLKVSLFV